MQEEFGNVGVSFEWVSRRWCTAGLPLPGPAGIPAWPEGWGAEGAKDLFQMVWEPGGGFGPIPFTAEANPGPGAIWGS